MFVDFHYSTSFCDFEAFTISAYFMKITQKCSNMEIWSYIHGITNLLLCYNHIVHNTFSPQIKGLAKVYN